MAEGLCVEMKGLVSAHFLCKLASSILSFILASPGLCHSPALPPPPACSPGGETACSVLLRAILLSLADACLAEFTLGMRRVLKGPHWCLELPLPHRWVLRVYPSHEGCILAIRPCVCARVCMNVHTCVHMYIWVCFCVYVHTCVHVGC